MFSSPLAFVHHVANNNVVDPLSHGVEIVWYVLDVLSFVLKDIDDEQICTGSIYLMSARFLE